MPNSVVDLSVEDLYGNSGSSIEFLHDIIKTNGNGTSSNNFSNQNPYGPSGYNNPFGNNGNNGGPSNWQEQAAAAFGDQQDKQSQYAQAYENMRTQHDEIRNNQAMQAWIQANEAYDQSYRQVMNAKMYANETLQTLSQTIPDKYIPLQEALQIREALQASIQESMNSSMQWFQTAGESQMSTVNPMRYEQEYQMQEALQTSIQQALQIQESLRVAMVEKYQMQEALQASMQTQDVMRAQDIIRAPMQVQDVMQAPMQTQDIIQDLTQDPMQTQDVMQTSAKGKAPIYDPPQMRVQDVMQAPMQAQDLTQGPIQAQDVMQTSAKGKAPIYDPPQVQTQDVMQAPMQTQDVMQGPAKYDNSSLYDMLKARAKTNSGMYKQKRLPKIEFVLEQASSQDAYTAHILDPMYDPAVIQSHIDVQMQSVETEEEIEDAKLQEAQIKEIYKTQQRKEKNWKRWKKIDKKQSVAEEKKKVLENRAARARALAGEQPAENPVVVKKPVIKKPDTNPQTAEGKTDWAKLVNRASNRFMRLRKRFPKILPKMERNFEKRNIMLNKKIAISAAAKDPIVRQQYETLKSAYRTESQILDHIMETRKTAYLKWTDEQKMAWYETELNLTENARYNVWLSRQNLVGQVILKYKEIFKKKKP